MIIPARRKVVHRKTGVMKSIANLQDAKTYMTLKSVKSDEKESKSEIDKKNKHRSVFESRIFKIVFITQ